MEIEAPLVNCNTCYSENDDTEKNKNSLDREPVDKEGIVYWGDGEDFHGQYENTKKLSEV